MGAASAVTVANAAAVAAGVGAMVQEMVQAAVTAASAKAVARVVAKAAARTAAKAVAAATNAVIALPAKKACAPRTPTPRARTTVAAGVATVMNADPRAATSHAAKAVANPVVKHAANPGVRAAAARARSAKLAPPCRLPKAQPKKPWRRNRSSTRCPVPMHRKRLMPTVSANPAAAATAVVAGVGAIVTSQLQRTAQARPMPQAHRAPAATRKHPPV